jgi:hypothetical protein
MFELEEMDTVIGGSLRVVHWAIFFLALTAQDVHGRESATNGSGSGAILTYGLRTLGRKQSLARRTTP